MPLFRKKPVVIEAVQYCDTDEGRGAVAQLAPGRFAFYKGRAVITTLEGEMIASPEDWIIKGVKGEVYPCKPDIFAATYEPA